MRKPLTKSLFLISISLFLVNAKSDKKSIKAKTIENSVTKISENLYAGKYEVSNWWYRQFLNDLEANNRSKDLKVAQIDSARWIPKGMNYNEPLVILYHRHPAYENYPVVNITYEGANLFCSWLTEKYNSLQGRKFNKVLFFLPNEQEWILAAKGKNENSIYAAGNFLKNKKGLPMANYRRTDIPDSMRVASSSEYLAPVGAYWENDFGIYNMSGNAAEMISEKGITKGGSFKNTEDDLKIDAKGNYKESACYIGFRYFVRVMKP